MGRKEQKIKVVSYVHVGDQLVNTQDLNPEQKRQLATWIKCTYLNALYEGKATFYPTDECDREKYLSSQRRTAQKSPQRVGGPAGGR